MGFGRMQIKCDCGCKNFNFFVELEKNSNYGKEILVCEDCQTVFLEGTVDSDVLTENWEATEEDLDWKSDLVSLGK